MYMANKKMTVVQKYDAIEKMLNGEVVENFSIEDALAFIGERKAQTIRKNTPNPDRKPTPKEQEKVDADTKSKALILEVLASADKALSINDIQKQSQELDMLSNQKLTYLLTALRKGGKIVRTEVKGKSHYSLPNG
jgi:tRNA splicing endonuclease